MFIIMLSITISCCGGITVFTEWLKSKLAKRLKARESATQADIGVLLKIRYVVVVFFREGEGRCFGKHG